MAGGAGGAVLLGKDYEEKQFHKKSIAFKGAVFFLHKLPSDLKTKLSIIQLKSL